MMDVLDLACTGTLNLLPHSMAWESTSMEKLRLWMYMSSVNKETISGNTRTACRSAAGKGHVAKRLGEKLQGAQGTLVDRRSGSNKAPGRRKHQGGRGAQILLMQWHRAAVK